MKLTVGQYLHLYEIHLSESDELDKSIQSVAVLTGKTESEIEAMPMTDFNKLSRQAAEFIHGIKPSTKPVSFIKANGREYQVNYKIATLTAGQNTDVQFWLREKDWVRNMDKILASVCVPVKRTLWWRLPKKYDSDQHKQIVEDLQHADFWEAYGCVVFFCKVFAASMTATLRYSEKELINKTGMTKEQLLTLETALQRITVGFSM